MEKQEARPLNGKAHPLMRKPVKVQKEAMETLFKYKGKKPEPEGIMRSVMDDRLGFASDDREERFKRFILALIDDSLMSDRCIVQG